MLWLKNQYPDIVLNMGLVSHSVKVLRDWSLITGRRGATKREGGHVKFYPYEKGGRKKF